MRAVLDDCSSEWKESTATARAWSAFRYVCPEFVRQRGSSADSSATALRAKSQHQIGHSYG